jgi:hypothetical protein
MKRYLLFFCLITGLSLNAQTINCGYFCVLNINNLNTVANTIDVTIFNGDTNHVNYPTVVLVDGTGDTVANINNTFYFFAHPAGDTVVHTIPCTMDSIPAGFTCTVYLTDQVWDTTCMFSYPMSCTVGIPELAFADMISLYPNPVDDHFSISLPASGELVQIRLIDVLGKERRKLNTSETILNISRDDLPQGMYFVEISSGGKRAVRKVVIR